jgi:hypothetical protein
MALDGLKAVKEKKEKIHEKTIIPLPIDLIPNLLSLPWE